MPTATAVKKAAPVKKAAGVKKAAPVAAAAQPDALKETSEARAARETRDAELTAQILELRDSEEKTSWFDIASQLEIGQGKAMFLYMIAHVDPSDVITFKDDDDLAAKVAKLRDDKKLSWGILAARSGVSEGKLKNLYEAATGVTAIGNRIGKGGRYPTGADRPAPAPKAAKTAKAAKAAKATEQEDLSSVELPPKGTPLADFTLKQLQARLNGKVIKVGRPNGLTPETVKVTRVTKVKDGEITLTDFSGKTRTVLAVQIKSASN